MKFRFVAFVVLFFVIIFTNSVQAASTNTVKIVKDQVILNGVLINNLNSEYPLIIYKNITYFPMTWDLSRYMGLETKWDPKSGLIINKVQSVTEYKASDNTFNNFEVSYPISIPKYSITINNEKINNSKEQYPLINFRGVTYFPLTWRFAVDAFGWKYSWSKAEGLRVNSGTETIEHEKESVISLINILTFGEKFNFTSSFTINSTGETKKNIKGERINEIEGPKFVTKAVFSEPLPYRSSVSIIGYRKSYTDLNPQNVEMGTGVDFTDAPFETIRSVAPGSTEINEAKLMIALLELHFIGEERKQIQSFDLVHRTEKMSTWRIKMLNKHIDIGIQDMEIVNIKMQDEDLTFEYLLDS